MGALRDQANQVFRNFRVDGNPESGPHSPKKADIRALFGSADDSLTASAEALAAAAGGLGLPSIEPGDAGKTLQVLATEDGYELVPFGGGSIGPTVLDFGAVGDGVTDDTAAFAAAIASGLTVIVPERVTPYIVGSAALDMPSGTSIVGLGKPTIKMMANAPAFAMFSAQTQRRSNIEIKGLILDGNRTQNIDHGTPDANGNQDKGWQGRTVALVNVAYVDGFVLEDCEIKNCMSSGVWMTDCTRYRINDNWVHDYRHTGIATRNDSATAGLTEAGGVRGNICEGGTVGIHCIFGVVNATVAGNVCRNNTDANRFPAYAYSGTYPNVYPSTGGFKASGVAGYVTPAMQGDGAGIECTGVHNPPATSSQRLSFTGNMCGGNQTGIRLEEVTMRCTVAGNICSENTTYGVFVFGGYYNVITGNACSGNGLDGIHLEAFSGNACDCHVVTGNGCTQNGRWGLYVGGGSTNVVSGNILCPNNTLNAAIGGGMGLYTAATFNSNRNAISGNVFANYNGNDKYGVYSDAGASGTTHQGNKVDASNVFVGLTTASSNLNTANNTVAV